MNQHYLKEMKTINVFIIFFACNAMCFFIYGQECRLINTAFVIRYNGECSNGLANGKGIAHYADSSFYAGKFENGMREGKGEMHFRRQNGMDSVVKGYWSGDVFRGKRYEQYKHGDEIAFSGFEFNFLGKDPNRLTIQIDFAKERNVVEMAPQIGGSVPLVTNIEVLESNKSIKQTSASETSMKTQYVYSIESYPIKLKVSLSDRRQMVFELNRSGDWLIQGYYIINVKVETKVESRVRN
jgi:hypothetical protein